MTWNRRLGAGLMLTALTLLALELVLARIFSVLMWYHFVSLIVSLALFGLTVSGLVVYLLPDRFSEGKVGKWLGRAALLLSLSIMADWGFFFILSRYPLAAYKVLSSFHQPFYEPFGPVAGSGYFSLDLALPLAILYLFAALPFFFGGFVATLLIWHFSSDISRVYFFDLAGAGLGCLATFLLLTVIDPFSVLGILAAAAAVAAFLFSRQGAGNLVRFLAAAMAVSGLAAAVLTSAGGVVDLNFVRGRYEPDILSKKWNSYSRVAVYPLRSGQMEGSWGLSRSFRGEVPPQLGMVVDDTGYSSIARYREGDDLSWARSTVFSLPYSLREGAETLIIGPGGGKDILVAKAMGSTSVKAVEINPLMVDAVQEVFADFSGQPYTLPGVEGVIDEGRTFLRRDSSRYDVIQAAVVYGRLAPSAGAFTLTEDHLYTLEAFHDYLDRLKPEGMLSISRFLFEKRILRLVATARGALEERGAASAGSHMFIAAERGLATVLVKSLPFTEEETAALEERCRRFGFDVVYSPGRENDNPFGRLLAAADAGEYYRGLPYDISPVTDDRPFFYYLLRPGDFFSLSPSGAGREFDDRAIVLIRNLLAVVIVLLLLFLALPLLLRGKAREIRWRGAWQAILYFASLGLGFVVVEISLLKRFLLLLGKPVYSLAVILSVFLIAGGIGSYRARRVMWNRAALRRRCGGLSILLLLLTMALPALLEGALPLSLGGRLIVTVLVVAPVGYLMGQPFPLGVALLKLSNERLIPWVWSVNGALSVLGSVLTLVLAVNFGYTATMLLGPAAYLTAAIVAEDL